MNRILRKWMKNRNSVRAIQELIEKDGAGRGLNCSALEFVCVSENAVGKWAILSYFVRVS